MKRQYQHLEQLDLSRFFPGSRQQTKLLAQLLPIVGIDMCLAENTSQSANGDHALLWHDSGIDDSAQASDKLDVTAFLTGLDGNLQLQAAT